MAISVLQGGIKFLKTFIGINALDWLSFTSNLAMLHFQKSFTINVYAMMFIKSLLRLVVVSEKIGISCFNFER